MKKKIQRADKEANGELIHSTVLAILQENGGRKPTIKAISDKTTLSISAVKKHIKNMSFKGQVDETCSLRLLTDRVKFAIYESAIAGNVAAMKLWFQIVEGWSEKTETKLEAKVQVDNKPPVIIHIE
jgi:hypothetical protein